MGDVGRGRLVLAVILFEGLGDKIPWMSRFRMRHGADWDESKGGRDLMLSDRGLARDRRRDVVELTNSGSGRQQGWPGDNRRSLANHSVGRYVGLGYGLCAPVLLLFSFLFHPCFLRHERLGS